MQVEGPVSPQIIFRSTINARLAGVDGQDKFAAFLCYRRNYFRPVAQIELAQIQGLHFKFINTSRDIMIHADGFA